MDSKNIAGLPRVLQEWDENQDREYSHTANHLVLAFKGSLNLPEGALARVAHAINLTGANVAEVLDTTKGCTEDIRMRELFQQIENDENVTPAVRTELGDLLAG
jgi:hypothetical protein